MCLPGLSTGNNTAPSSELVGRLPPHSSLGQSVHLVVWRELWSALRLLQARVFPPVSVASILRPLWGTVAKALSPTLLGAFPPSTFPLSLTTASLLCVHLAPAQHLSLGKTGP